MNLKDRIEEILLEYVAIKTHTGTELEINNEIFFKRWFESVPYLKENPEYCGFYPVKNDYLNRTCPWALLKGNGNDTVILMHHTDTVDVDDFGAFKDLAYQPYTLEKFMKEGNVELDDAARNDLASEEWMFGRGASDMKGGGCIHLALFEQYCQQQEFNGNLLILAVPDEENLSAGMRSAAFLLKELREKYQLEYKLLLNVEPHERMDEKNITIYDGSVGKLMPVFLVRGKLSHVGQIYKGLNPIHLLSAIVRKTEINPDFIEKDGNTITPPPAWLYFKDRKEIYDVSLPLYAGGYMSVLSLTSSPKEILSRLKVISKEAFNDVLADMKKSYETYNQGLAGSGEGIEWEPKVKFYSEIYAEISAERGETFKQEINVYQIKLEKSIRANEITRVEGIYKLMEKTLEYGSDLSPVVVIALAPPYYPSTNNTMLSNAAQTQELIDKLKAYAAEEMRQEIYTQNYFTGISDLSYAMFTLDQEDIEYISSNMLFWGDMYYIPLDIIKEQSMPVLNVGPWGKDLHKYTERVFKPDLFDHTPKLVDYLIKTILN
ncbi:M20/M25/M40 family metallo-hydrolase [Clostridium aminobutyricum]|uniref:M20/M25/M40 family metallo-hydrolase n=1 Tax=Clostridium aminobutyricum TaxID=33953 RepID=A0A939D8N3_CLOAM|nr:M20/M25/M40 family metallo-hydrolase [Clostridium aminobutyricum]MBN7773267.1 M20/M25/M40 family metallo-hydrolase [Clostridium aminobutyricum]